MFEKPRLIDSKLPISKRICLSTSDLNCARPPQMVLEWRREAVKLMTLNKVQLKRT